MRYLSLGQQRILLLLALFLIGILYFKFYYSSSPSSEEITKEIVVEIQGEVRKPGIHIFKKPPALKEAIEKAGGLKEAAQLDAPSSSEVLESGTLLTVHKEASQIPPVPPFTKVSPTSPSFAKGGMGRITQDEIKIKIGRMEANKLLIFSIPLDLNRVSVEDLCLLPEIGESLAREIVTYRQRRKGFRSIEELKNVKGIGEKKYQSLKTFFIVRR